MEMRILACLYSVVPTLLSVLTLAAIGQAAEAATLSGSVQISGTIIKTEGGKSDKDVIVYLEHAEGGEYPEPPKAPVVIDQVGSVFIPHVVAIQKGGSVDFLNSDSFEHNVFSVDDCCGMDLGNFAGGEKANHVFNEPGEGVMLCKLHPEMAAYVIVLNTPYFVKVEIDGDSQSATYRLENVPAGKYILKAWNKKTVAPELAVSLTDDSDTQADITLKKKERRRRKKK